MAPRQRAASTAGEGGREGGGIRTPDYCLLSVFVDAGGESAVAALRLRGADAEVGKEELREGTGEAKEEVAVRCLCVCSSLRPSIHSPSLNSKCSGRMKEINNTHASRDNINTTILH